MTRDRKSKTLYLDQEHYINTVLERFGYTYEKYKPKAVPLVSYEAVRPPKESDKYIDVTEY